MTVRIVRDIVREIAYAGSFAAAGAALACNNLGRTALAGWCLLAQVALLGLVVTVDCRAGT